MGERNDGIGVGCRIDGWRICSSRPPDRAPAIRPVNQARAARPSRVHAARPCRYWTMYRRLLRHRTCGASRARRGNQLWAVLSGRYPRARPPGTTNRRGNRHDQQALGHARRALCLVGGAARARQLSNGKDSCPRLVLLTGAQAGTLRPPMHAHCHRPTKRERVWQPFLVCIARLREAHSSLPEGGLHCVARLRRRGVAASGGRATARSVTESDANTSLRPGMHCEGGTSREEHLLAVLAPARVPPSPSPMQHIVQRADPLVAAQVPVVSAGGDELAARPSCCSCPRYSRLSTMAGYSQSS